MLNTAKYFILQNFTILESYHSGSSFVFCHNDQEVNSRNTVFTQPTNQPGVCLPVCDWVTSVLASFNIFNKDIVNAMIY